MAQHLYSNSRSATSCTPSGVAHTLVALLFQNLVEGVAHSLVVCEGQMKALHS